MSRENMTDGPCSLCGNDGRGERGLFLCESHVALIVKEYEWKLFDDVRSALAIAEAKLAKVRSRHGEKIIPIANPMGHYFSYCVGCSKIKPKQNPCTNQTGLVPFPCPTYQDTEEQE